MRKILTIAWNDIKIEFSERSTLVFFLILPIVFTLILGSALGGAGGEEESGDQRFIVLVSDEDGTDLSRQLLAQIETSQEIRPVERPAAEAASLVEDGQVVAALTIPAGFEAALLEGQPASLDLLLAQDNNAAVAAEQAVRASLSRLDGAVRAALAATSQAGEIRPFDQQDEQQAYFLASLERAQEVLSRPAAQVELASSPQTPVRIASGFEQASSGQLVTWTLLTLLAASGVFVDERLGGTLRRLLVTPTRKATILLGKVAGRYVMGILQMTLLIGFGAWVLKVNWGRSPAALALVVGAFGLAAVALGVLLGAFSKTRSQASGLTVFFSMLTAALGGAWWPLEITPPTYQAVVRVLPTTWAMSGFNDVILRGQGVAGVLPEVGVLLLFAAVFFGIGLARLRFE